MKTLFSNSKIKVIRIEHDDEYIIKPGAVRDPGFIICAAWRRPSNMISHLPMFRKKTYYIINDKDEKIFSFVPEKSVCGFCYKEENGEWSLPWVATYCTIEGEGDCIILGQYTQSAGADKLQNASPFDDFYGVVWTDTPRRCFKEIDENGHEHYARYDLLRVKTNCNEYLCR